MNLQDFLRSLTDIDGNVLGNGYAQEYFLRCSSADYFYEGKEVTLVHVEGGGEGGGEACYSVFRVGSKLFGVDYLYFSHQGFYLEDAELYEVQAIERLVTFYER